VLAAGYRPPFEELVWGLLPADCMADTAAAGEAEPASAALMLAASFTSASGVCQSAAGAAAGAAAAVIPQARVRPRTAAAARAQAGGA